MDKVYDNENAYMTPKYSRGGEFMENMVSDNLLEFCKRWFHLAGFNEIIEDMNEFYKQYTVQYGTQDFIGEFGIDKNGELIVHPVKDISRLKAIKPIFFTNNGVTNPIVLLGDMKKSGVNLDEYNNRS